MEREPDGIGSRHRGLMDSSLDAWLRRRGGVAHTQTARDAGYSRYRMAEAVASGSVLRVRRSWLTTSDCRVDLRIAAAHGGRLTCLSAASAMGLWTPEPPRVPHIVVPPAATHPPPVEAVVHWAQGPVSIARTEPHEHPLNVLFHVARCAPRADALAVWESALRTRVVDAGILQRVRWHSSRAGELAALAGALSDSGLETRFVDVMRRAGVTVRQQVWIDSHPLDGLIGERLAVQLDGFAHHRARDRRRDLRADARLALRGFTMLRFDYEQVFFEPAYVVDTVCVAIAQGLHRA